MQSDGNPYAFAIRDNGVIEASGIANREGQIVLLAEDGVVIESGSLTAAGGSIHILGDEIHIVEKASLNVSSPESGGAILIGHGYLLVGRSI